MLNQVIISIVILAAVGILSFLQIGAFRPLTTVKSIAAKRGYGPQRQRELLHTVAFDEWENEGGAAQPSKR
jgi:hypothetical protein